MNYELLPLTPQALENDYAAEQARERKCKSCEVRKSPSLRELVGYECDMGLCPEEE